jgi:hypothetical protein
VCGQPEYTENVPRSCNNRKSRALCQSNVASEVAICTTDVVENNRCHSAEQKDDDHDVARLSLQVWQKNQSVHALWDETTVGLMGALRETRSDCERGGR